MEYLARTEENNATYLGEINVNLQQVSFPTFPLNAVFVAPIFHQSASHP
jgi:hypothetical protein